MWFQVKRVDIFRMKFIAIYLQKIYNGVSDSDPRAGVVFMKEFFQRRGAADGRP